MHKDKINTSFDLILLMLFTVSSIFLIVQLFLTNLFSIIFNFFVLISLLGLVVLFFVIFFKSREYLLIKRIVLISFCVAISLSTVYIRDVTIMMNQNEENRIETHYKLNLITIDSKIDDSSKLHENSIGVLMNDRNYINSFEDINKSFHMNDCVLKEYHTMSNLVKALETNKIQGAILSDHNLDLLHEYHSKTASQIQVLNENVHTVEISHKAKKVNYEKAFTLLLSVSDNEKLNHVSDTQLCYILFIDPMDKTIEIVNLPNDLYIPNVAYDSFPDRLSNTSYHGIDNLLYSIESVLDVEFDYFVKTNMSTFMNMVDVMQGIVVQYEECLDGACIYLTEQLDASKTKQFIEEKKDIYPILEGVFNRRHEIAGSKLLNLLNCYSNHTFSNLSTNNFKDFLKLINSFEWKISKVEDTQLRQGNYPCISTGTNTKYPVSILSLNYIYSLYDQFVQLRHIDTFKFFEFDLNTIYNSTIKPTISNKLVTTNNMNWKIDAYYSMLPSSTIQPVEVEKWQGNFDFDEPNFDPDGLIYPIE